MNFIFAKILIKGVIVKVNMGDIGVVQLLKIGMLGVWALQKIITQLKQRVIVALLVE